MINVIPTYTSDQFVWDKIKNEILPIKSKFNDLIISDASTEIRVVSINTGKNVRYIYEYKLNIFGLYLYRSFDPDGSKKYPTLYLPTINCNWNWNGCRI